MYVTRIAPSPTGDMHIGTARTAYFNWLAARASGGRFILRIDDTDDARNRQECVDVIYRVMDWLKLDYDQTFKQSERQECYTTVAQRMVRDGDASILDNGAIGINSPIAESVMERRKTWKDMIGGDILISQQDHEVASKTIIMKADGRPTYHFATVIDDADMNVNCVIRGVDHLTNTVRHAYIYVAADLVHAAPKYAHVGLIMKDKKKISKRDGAASMLKYMEANYHPEAMLNFLLRMGWGPKVDNKENSIIPRDKALKMFLNEGSMRAAPSGFDQAKLDWYDKKYKAGK